MNAKISFFSICLLLINVFYVAAEEALPEPEEPPIGPPELKVPIDSHLIWLVIAGVILGIVILYRNKKSFNIK